MSKFRADCRYHIWQNDLFSRWPAEEPDGNALLYISTYFLMLHKFGELSDYDIEHLLKIYYEATISPGILSRGKHKKDDPASHDDHAGIAAAAYIMDRSILTDFIRKKNKFLLPIGHKQHLKLCNNEGLSLWGKFAWSWNLWTTTWRKIDDSSGRILDWIKIYIYENRKMNYGLCNWAIKKWKADIRKRYPRLMGHVFSVYFDRNPDLSKPLVHPFAVHMQDKL